MKHLIFLLLAMTVLLFSCKNRSENNMQLSFPEEDSIPMAEAEALSEEAIADIVQNISSPVEIAALMQALGIPFSNKHLAPTDAAKTLNTSFERALKLGIYGADLGYLNMYDKTNTAIDNLSTIKNLADGIRVGQFFDFETLKRLATNRNSLDSLLYISIHSFNQIDEYLRENKRGNLSTLMVSGVWLEALYLATQVAITHPHEMMMERIGEQKLIINDLMLLLRPYKDMNDYSDLYADFMRLKEAYKEIDITYTIGEPETVEQDGRLVVVQNDESHVDITNEQLQEIIRLTEEIRNKLINQ